MRLLLASTNAHKKGELTELLLPLGVEVLTPDEVGGLPEVIEDGATFAANAEKKALSGAAASGLWTLADDSGLEVDALEGRPGVYSARYAGPDANDGANNDKLLAELGGVPEAERTARFVCALALASPDGKLAFECTGFVRGRILEARRGDGGFGYDPLFLFTEDACDGAGQTFAELPSHAKSKVSHRGRALRQLAEKLAELDPTRA